MTGGFIAFRCCNFENTAEREQFRTLCNVLKDKYAQSEKFCLLIANYNIFDCEFDSILIKNDAIIAVEFKNYGGNIIATENGDWTANGEIIKGGSRKTVYQQARVNHVALRNGLHELGFNKNWIKDIPSLIVFNQEAILENHLSGKVRSWLHITDNKHFIEKVEDITCKFTNISNKDIIDIAIKMNLNRFIDYSLSSFPFKDSDKQETHSENLLEGKKLRKETCDLSDVLTSYKRITPNHVYYLKQNQIFVFGTDTKGSQLYGAAGLAAKRFKAEKGIFNGPTGNCYALPTKGFNFSELSSAVEQLLIYVKNHSNNTFLVTPVGCGHAGFNVNEVAALFKPFLKCENVMLPEMFIKIYVTENVQISNKEYEIANK